MDFFEDRKKPAQNQAAGFISLPACVIVVLVYLASLPLTFIFQAAISPLSFEC